MKDATFARLTPGTPRAWGLRVILDPTDPEPRSGDKITARKKDGSHRTVRVDQVLNRGRTDRGTPWVLCSILRGRLDVPRGPLARVPFRSRLRGPKTLATPRSRSQGPVQLDRCGGCGSPWASPAGCPACW